MMSHSISVEAKNIPFYLTKNEELSFCADNNEIF